MISPLIVEEVRLKLVPGVHTTSASSTKISSGVPKINASTDVRSVPVAFGFMDSPGVQWVTATDLRELSALFLKMADALEVR